MNNNNNNNIKPAQFQVFKGKAAIRFQLAKPEEDYKVGCLFMQIAPAKGSRGSESGYDWENKISVKLGVNDVSTVKYSLSRGLEADLFHTFRDDKKTIKFSPKDDGGYFVNVSQNGNGHNVVLSAEEVDSLVTLLTFTLPSIHNWI